MWTIYLTEYSGGRAILLDVLFFYFHKLPHG